MCKTLIILHNLIWAFFFLVCMAGLGGGGPGGRKCSRPITLRLLMTMNLNLGGGGVVENLKI